MAITLHPSKYRRVALQGQFIDGQTGIPIPSPAVHVATEGENPSMQKDSPTGVFDHFRLEAGVIQVAGSAPGYACEIVTKPQLPVGDHDLALVQLVPANSLFVHIVDESGNPWREGAFELLNEEGGGDSDVHDLGKVHDTVPQSRGAALAQ